VILKMSIFGEIHKVKREQSGKEIPGWGKIKIYSNIEMKLNISKSCVSWEYGLH